MEIPRTATNAIAATFYDTELKHRTVTMVADAEGGVKKTAGAVLHTFKGNPQPVSDELQEALLGQSIKAEYRVTAPTEPKLRKGDLLEFGNEIYEIKDAKPYQSHAEYLVGRWTECE